MRYISRLDGVRKVFKSKKEYDAYLEKMKAEGKMRSIVRDRSRKKRPRVERDDDWRRRRNKDNVEMYSPQRHPRLEIPKPKNHVRQTFTLIHPSRGRPIQAWNCMYRWIDSCSPYNKLEYILSIDSDEAPRYFHVVKRMKGEINLRVVIWDNSNIVQALNRGAKYSTGDVLIYVSDDFECPPNWDIEIQKRTVDRDDWVLGVYDGLQSETQTISILSRKYYERFGYIYYPKYISMYADPDFTQVAKRTGKLIPAFDLLFKHNHYTANGEPYDATYEKQNSPQAWAHGEALFRERMSRNFDL